MSSRTVAYRALGLGDLLTAVPALRGLRAALPDTELVLATTAGVAALGSLVDAVDSVCAVGELAPLPTSLHRPDVAVNLHGVGPQSTDLLRAAAPGRLVAYDERTWPDRVHEVERWCSLVDQGFEGRCDRSALHIARPDAPPPVAGAVVIHPGAAFRSRRWPPDRFAAVARELARRGGRVVVTGSAAERALAADVGAQAGLEPESVLAGRTDVLALAALVADAALVVCGDTGVAHLATAYGRRSVLLFGPTPPEAWGPPPLRRHAVLHRGDGTGDPFGSVPDPALLAIGVPEVLAAVETVLTRSEEPGPQVDEGEIA